jgi:DNA-binding NtrC family response regulator
MIVYSNDENFCSRIREIFNDERYVVKTVGLFTDVVESLQKELFDVLVIDLGSIREVYSLLRIFDNILLGMPIIVAGYENGLKIEEGVNSRFYFFSKFSGKDEWRSLIKVVADENYIITSRVDLK